MKTVVFAYHTIGCVGIKALLEQGFEIRAVFTHPDDPGETTWFQSVAELAASRNIPVYAPEAVNHPFWVTRIKGMNPDIIFSFYYRNLLKKELLDIPAQGAFNLHGSLLPRYRGRCPVNWVLVHGEKETGVTLHHMTLKPDEGDIVGQLRVLIDPKDTAQTLHGKLATASERLLADTLPQLREHRAGRTPQDAAQASYFGGRQPKDGVIDWRQSAEAVHNLVRAVTRPYPGAFSFWGGRKCFFWSVTPLRTILNALPGTVVSTQPLTVACAEGAVEVRLAQMEGEVCMSGDQWVAEHNLASGMQFGAQATGRREGQDRGSVLILGVNGFIGNHLSKRLLDGGYTVYGMDLCSSSVEEFKAHPRFHFTEGDISIMREWIEYHVRKCDIVVPLVAIATPMEYVRNPLRVFELDFEENLRVVRYCVKYKKRLVFPSTSEVYGMCEDEEFDERDSNLVLGPIHKQRWIYSCSKQMLDRVIWAYGVQHGLQFTLFRPFNWIGPKLDSLESARIGSSRVITRFILNLVEGTPIQLVDGGEQKRCFTDVQDGIECLFRIIENRGGVCDGKIFNIGNPDNAYSMRQLAETLLDKFSSHPLRSTFPVTAGTREVTSQAFYGTGYQDVQHRRPSIRQARHLLGWSPRVCFDDSINTTLDYFLNATAGQKRC